MATISCTPATRSVVSKDVSTQMTTSQNVSRTSETQVTKTFKPNESQMPEGNDHVKKQKSKHVKSKHVKTGGAAATVGNEPTQNLRPSDSPACEPARSDSPASGPMSGSPSAKGVPKGGVPASTTSLTPRSILRPYPAIPKSENQSSEGVFRKIGAGDITLQHNSNLTQISRNFTNFRKPLKDFIDSTRFRGIPIKFGTKGDEFSILLYFFPGAGG